LPVGIAANADDAETQEAYHPLITHWDFEDDPTTEEDETYLDKADGDDTLIKMGNVTVTDGVAYVPSVENVYLSASAGTEENPTDIYDMSNKTIVTKAKVVVSGTRPGVGAMFAKVNSFGFGIDNSEPAKTQPLLYWESKNTTSPQIVTNTVSTEPMVFDEMRVFVMTFSYDTTDGINKYEVRQYMSTKENPESAADFILMAKISGQKSSTSQYQSAYMATEGELILGKRYGQTNKDRALDVYFDDVKIYEGVLTPAQLVDDNSPTFRASQIATPKSGVTAADTFAVRFVGTVNAVTMDTLGYTLTANAAGVTDKDLSGTVKNVYGEIIANTEKGVRGYTAKTDFYSGGIFTYTIHDIPTSLLADGGYVEFTVTPYSETKGKPLTGESYTVRIELIEGEDLDMDDYNSYKTTITKVEG